MFLGDVSEKFLVFEVLVSVSVVVFDFGVRFEVAFPVAFAAVDHDYDA